MTSKFKIKVGMSHGLMVFSYSNQTEKEILMWQMSQQRENLELGKIRSSFIL